MTSLFQLILTLTLTLLLFQKSMMRQFVLMKQQDEVPCLLTVGDMKAWLLAGRRFMEECGEMIEMMEARERLMAELAWTTARRLCLSHMEQELMEELDEEERLSRLLNRKVRTEVQNNMCQIMLPVSVTHSSFSLLLKVTREGFQMFITVIRPEAEKDVEPLLTALFSMLLKVFADDESAGEPKRAEVLLLEKQPALLEPEVVETILKFLLEEPESQNKAEAAGAEIGKLLAESAAPHLAAFGSFPRDLNLSVCTAAASSMVQTVYERFNESCKSFRLMDYDMSFLTARESVIRAVEEMEAAAADKALRHHLHISEGLKEPGQEGVENPPQEQYVPYTLFNTCIIL
ncbi:uncharacterized protein [Labrus bergylta]|uniref:uncharacterized protein isoform X1 n=1 Tax=Labrus bergylta TaxID=56723 RepID=UPI003313A5E7